MATTVPIELLLPLVKEEPPAPTITLLLEPPNPKNGCDVAKINPPAPPPPPLLPLKLGLLGPASPPAPPPATMRYSTVISVPLVFSIVPEVVNR
jgi:hypothetical protein